MSRIESSQALTPSLLDRLIDPDSGGTAWRPGYGIEQVQEAVRRDLEYLLNTQTALHEIPPEYAEARNSLLSFGVPDVTSISRLGTQVREQIGRAIEESIRAHEPRLREVRATPLDDAEDPKQMRIRYQITAKLHVEPFPEVAFTTILKLTTGQTSVASGEV